MRSLQPPCITDHTVPAICMICVQCANLRVRRVKSAVPGSEHTCHQPRTLSGKTREGSRTICKSCDRVAQQHEYSKCNVRNNVLPYTYTFSNIPIKGYSRVSVCIQCCDSLHCINPVYGICISITIPCLYCLYVVIFIRNRPRKYLFQCFMSKHCHRCIYVGI